MGQVDKFIESAAEAQYRRAPELIMFLSCQIKNRVFPAPANNSAKPLAIVAKVLPLIWGAFFAPTRNSVNRAGSGVNANIDRWIETSVLEKIHQLLRRLVAAAVNLMERSL